MSCDVSRREFLRLTGLAIGGAVLAACGVATTRSTAPAATSPDASGGPAGAATGGAGASPVRAPKPGRSTTPSDTASAAIGGALAILGRPTDRSVTVNSLPAADGRLVIEYGTASGSYTARTAEQQVSAGVPVETVIAGLAPGTRYFWRADDGSEPGPEGSFTTQRAPGSAFTFEIAGDSHPERLGKEFDPGLYVRMLSGAAADDPDFYIAMGDDFSVDALKTVDPDTVRALYVTQRGWMGRVGRPLFLVNGNHEQAALANLDGTPDNVAVWAQTARNANYPQPGPDRFYSGDAEPVDHIGLLRDYYAWTWGDALFAVIDFYWHSPVVVDNAFGAGHGTKAKRDLWQVTLGDAQYAWLKRTLESSDARYKFVFAHHVLGTGRGGVELAGTYEWGDEAGLASHRPGWASTIHRLMAEAGVTVFFQGHDHIFVRQELDGVVYQTLAEPADPNDALNNAAAYRSGDKLPSSGRLRVGVAPSGVKVEYVRSYLEKPDEIADSYTIV